MQLESEQGDNLLEKDQRHQTKAACQADDPYDQLSQSLQNSAAALFLPAVAILIYNNRPFIDEGFETTIGRYETQECEQQSAAAHLQDLGQVSLPPGEMVSGEEVKPDQR